MSVYARKVEGGGSPDRDRGPGLASAPRAWSSAGASCAGMGWALSSISHQVDGCSLMGAVELLRGDVRARVDLRTGVGMEANAARVSFEGASLRGEPIEARGLRLRAEILRARACLLEDESTRIRLGVQPTLARVSWFVAEVGFGSVCGNVDRVDPGADHLMIEGEDAWIVPGAIFGSVYEDGVHDLQSFFVSWDRASRAGRST